jgi:uncharacterized membrane protein
MSIKFTFSYQLILAKNNQHPQLFTKNQLLTTKMPLPPEILVLFVAMLPVLELNAAIPLGLLLHMPIEAAFFWAQIGNIIPVMLILKLLEPISGFLMKHFHFFNIFFTKLFDKTRKKHSQKFEQVGSILLITLIAIPLPGAGAWTASLLAFLFDLPYWRSVLLILAGNIIAGFLICLGFGGAMEVGKFFIK